MPPLILGLLALGGGVLAWRAFRAEQARIASTLDRQQRVKDLPGVDLERDAETGEFRPRRKD